jgi:hypothetical protein
VHRFDGSGDFTDPDSLQKVGRCPGLHRRQNIGLIVVGAQYDDGGNGTPDLQLLDGLDTAQTGHGHIDYGHVRLKLTGQSHGFLSVTGHSHDLQPLFLPEDTTQSLTKRSMIVGQKDLDLLPGVLGGLGPGGGHLQISAVLMQ